MPVNILKLFSRKTLHNPRTRLSDDPCYTLVHTNIAGEPICPMGKAEHQHGPSKWWPWRIHRSCRNYILSHKKGHRLLELKCMWCQWLEDQGGR